MASKKSGGAHKATAAKKATAKKVADPVPVLNIRPAGDRRARFRTAKKG